jgi:hypothetical protein
VVEGEAGVLAADLLGGVAGGVAEEPGRRPGGAERGARRDRADGARGALPDAVPPGVGVAAQEPLFRPWLTGWSAGAIFSAALAIAVPSPRSPATPGAPANRAAHVIAVSTGFAALVLTASATSPTDARAPEYRSPAVSDTPLITEVAAFFAQSSMSAPFMPRAAQAEVVDPLYPSLVRGRIAGIENAGRDVLPARLVALRRRRVLVAAWIAIGSR